MNATRFLLLAIALGLVACLVVGFVMTWPKSTGPENTKWEMQERMEIVQLAVAHLAEGKPLSLTNPEQFTHPRNVREGTEAVLFQVPDEFLSKNWFHDSRIRFRSHSDAMTGQFATAPDWMIGFDLERSRLGIWTVKITNVQGPTRFVWELAFEKQFRSWRATVRSMSIGCG